MIGILTDRAFAMQEQLRWDRLGQNSRLLRTRRDLAGVDGIVVALQKKNTIDLSADFCRGIYDHYQNGAGLLALGWGAQMVAQNGRIPILSAAMLMQPLKKKQLRLVEVPSWRKKIPLYFYMIGQYKDIAPNIAILAKQNQTEAVILREGNLLVCSGVPVKDSDEALYRYFCCMIRQ